MSSSEGNQDPSARHRQWLATKTMKSNFDCLETMMDDTFNRYEE
jgi:hypothetical protein